MLLQHVLQKKKRGLIFFDKAALCFSDNPVGAHSERSVLLLHKKKI
jgi:hypothetical protein